MEGLLDFLRKYSDVDIDFIQQFLEIRKGDNLHAPFSIDLDIVVDWLNANKAKMKKTLLKTYRENVDYILLDPMVEQKHGGHNKEIVLLTPDTFKMLCMKSKTRDAQKVRYYYVTLEKLVEVYKDDIIKNQDSKIKILERNLKNTVYPVKGALYILQLTPDDDEGFKIGKTMDMNKRLQVYKTSMKDSPDVTYIFYSNDVHRLEKCVKNALKYYEYRKDKEYPQNLKILWLANFHQKIGYYKITRDEIIEAIRDCQFLITKYTCKDCDKEDMKTKDLRRHNNEHHETKNEIIITTVVEYDNDYQRQNGGYAKCNYDTFVTYKLNKALYKELKNIDMIMNAIDKAVVTTSAKSNGNIKVIKGIPNLTLKL